MSSANFYTCSSLRTYIVWLKALKNDIFQCISRSKNFQVIFEKWGVHLSNLIALRFQMGVWVVIFTRYMYLLLLFFILFTHYNKYIFFSYILHKSNKFGFKRELKEILRRKLLTFSSRSPHETEESPDQRPLILWPKFVRKIGKDPRSVDSLKTEQKKYSAQKNNTIQTEFSTFPFILKLIFFFPSASLTLSKNITYSLFHQAGTFCLWFFLSPCLLYCISLRLNFWMCHVFFFSYIHHLLLLLIIAFPVWNGFLV